MRCYTKPKEPKTYEVGDTRTVNRFLIIPKRLRNEWRWLERATIEQTYYKYTDGLFTGIYLWTDTAWYNQ